MKRMMALLLCLMLSVMLLASCGGGEKTPEQLIEDAFDATEALDAVEFEMVITTTMTYSMGGQSQSQTMPVTINGKITGAQTESPKIYLEVSMTNGSETENGVIYVEGDWVYVTSEYDGETSEFKVSMENSDEIGLDSYNPDFDDLFADLPSELFSDITATSNDDGSKTVALSLTAEQMKTIFKGLASSIVGEDLDSAEDEGAEIAFAPATLTVSVKDGFVSCYKLVFGLTASMDMDGDPLTDTDIMEMTYAFDYDIDFTKTSGVTITPPEGYLEFVDMTEME